MSTNITKGHSDSFNALRNPKYDNFALFSCFLEGKPTCAIVTVNQDGEEYIVQPLFVAVTPGMKLVDHDGNEIEV